MYVKGQNRGTKNAKAKLTEDDVMEIYHSTEKYAVLRTRYRVSHSCISHIKNMRTWKWLFDERGNVNSECL